MTIQEFLDNGNIIVHNTGDSYNVYLRNGMPVATNIDKKMLIKLVGKM